MADIQLGSGDDTYVQSSANKNLWDTVHGNDGNDILRVYQGTVHGGKGNDRIERIADTENPNRDLQIAYWSAGDNLRINLVEGWAEDGLGGRDTFNPAEISRVHGSGARNAWVLGDERDNFYYANSGTDTFIGGGGNDTIDLYHAWYTPGAGQPGRRPSLSEVTITVAVDGRSATFAPRVGSGFTYTVQDVEFFEILDAAVGTAVEGPRKRYTIADFITHASIAEQAVAAGGEMRWNQGSALGTAVAVSYSFVTTAPASGVGLNGFRPFTPVEQQLVREFLSRTAALTGLSFAEVAETSTSAGEMRFGVSQQLSSKGVAFMPNQPGAGSQAGDVWMDIESMVGIAPGTEGYQALLHEIGHALGLRHLRNVDAGDAWAVEARPQDDRQALSVMSQNASGDGLFRADWGVLDVLALRYLYGTRARDVGDTRWVLGTVQAGAEGVIVDDGGNDTLDASAYGSGVRLDLRPGRLSSVGETADGRLGVDNLGLPATTHIENAIGSSSDDVLIGNDAANTLTGGLGNDWIEGGLGSDTATFAGRRADYLLSTGFGKVFLAARDGASGFDTLLDVEALRFADGTVSLSTTVLAQDVTGALDEDTLFTMSLPTPSDMARTAVTYRVVGSAAHGSASVDAAGLLTYRPAANYNGADAVAFEIVAGTAVNRYVAHLTVQPVNDAVPVSRAGAYVVGSDAMLSAWLPLASDADGDAVTYRNATDPVNGTLGIEPSGSFTYRARSGFSGTDSFNFAVSDGLGGVSSYPVSMTVLPVARSVSGSAAADGMLGLSGAEYFRAGAGDDRITGQGGNDVIDGEAGIDTAAFAGMRTAYQLTKAPYGWVVRDTLGTDGTDHLTAVERAQFGNTAWALDMGGNAGAVTQILRALFGPAFVTNKTFVGIGLYYADSGMAYRDLVSLAVGTPEFAAMAGSRSNTAFVNHVYKNVVGVAPGPADLAYYAGLLDSGQYAQVELAQLACEAAPNTASVQLVGLAETGIEYTPFGA